jgi:uncharacterized protein YgfB (UPF0149 family)
MNKYKSSEALLSSSNLASQVLPNSALPFDDLHGHLSDSIPRFRHQYLSLASLHQNDPSASNTLAQQEYVKLVEQMQKMVVDTLANFSMQLHTAMGDWKLFCEVFQEEVESASREANIVKHVRI